MLLAASMGGVACVGSLVFWVLNQMDKSGRERAFRRQQGEYSDWQ
jgi:hypothetical protein